MRLLHGIAEVYKIVIISYTADIYSLHTGNSHNSQVYQVNRIRTELPASLYAGALRPHKALTPSTSQGLC